MQFIRSVPRVGYPHMASFPYQYHITKGLTLQSVEVSREEKRHDTIIDDEGVVAETGITALEFFFALADGKTTGDMNAGTFALAEGMDGKIYVGTSGGSVHHYYGKPGEGTSIKLESFTYSGSSEATEPDSSDQHNGTNIDSGTYSGRSVDAAVPDGDANSSLHLPFVDVRESYWYYSAVRYVFERGLMVGMAEDRFDSNATLTRAMIVTILHRHAGNPIVSGLDNQFDDVLENHWYTDAIKWASSNGIVLGYGRWQVRN